MFRSCSPLCAGLLSMATGAVSAKPKQASAPSRAYVDTSYPIAPKAVGDCALTRRNHDPAAKLAGAGFVRIGDFASAILSPPVRTELPVSP
ncbi:hypothetical protein [Xanthomonas theicola]|uniref:hypothetical protein n=1 Tax=Xanthomonas theicola TaxID=56464 RepID=UPI000FF88A19|nr:hypothetical protein [Xanthomonas theicola]QNH25045.1 hypothetical protein G4Q83_10280 [Xanthomonas theicola]